MHLEASATLAPTIFSETMLAHILSYLFRGSSTMRSLIPRKRRELRTLSDNLFENFWSDVDSLLYPAESMLGLDWFTGRSSYPRVNVKNEPSQIVIDASVPGLTKENVNVEYQDGVLTISGQSQNKSQENGDRYVLRELHKSAFARTFDIPEDKFLVEKISAEVDNGLLSVIIPKKEAVIEEKKESKKIEVK